MKKVLFVSILAGLALVGCTNDELVDNGGLVGGNSETIGFVVDQNNMTRADLQNSHYEFGVYAKNGASSDVMVNYLVAWANGTNLYAPFQSAATTYGDPTSQVDGLSYWFYEGLTPTVGTDYNKADNTQILKFWDKSTANTEFWAYTPYTTANTAAAPMTDNNAKKVAFNGTDFVFTDLSSFYTNPVADKQIASADKTAANAIGGADGATDMSKYNAEMLNYNEALYAYTKVQKDNYGEDVALNFKHINAQVKLAFYNAVPGYNIRLMDVVPTGADAPKAGTFTPTTAPGIQLTPAKYSATEADNQTLYKKADGTYAVQTATTNLPKYCEAGDVTVTDVAGSTETKIAVADGTATNPQNKNLVFSTANTAGNAYITTDATGSVSTTTLYTLPNWDGSASAYIDGDVSKETGYTLHVSYALVPQDGTAEIKIYDARVYISADYCKWEAGKAYTYIFKITKNSNGTTDPSNEVDKNTAGSASEQPYVDASDPRVPDDAALQPIVFDKLTVTDYVTGGVTDVFEISQATLETAYEKALKSLVEIFTTGSTTLASLQSVTGSGTKDAPYTLTYSAKVGDFKWPSWSTETGGWAPSPLPADINDNNVFKDLQALSQAFFNQSGIETIKRLNNFTDLNVLGTFTRDYGQTPPSWYGSGLSLEGTVANAAFTSMYTTDNDIRTGDAADVYLELVDSKSPANSIYVKIGLTVEAD